MAISISLGVWEKICPLCGKAYQTTKLKKRACDTCTEAKSKVWWSKYLLKKKLEYEPKRRESKFREKEEFFRIWSPHMAYVLGFICADGHVNRRGLSPRGDSGFLLEISSSDLEIVEKIAPLLGSFEIKVTKPRSVKYKPIHYFRSYNVHLIRPLYEMGVRERKSYNLPPLPIPGDLFWHFLRGYTDGDGWVGFAYSKDRQRKYLSLGWCTASRDFVFWLRDQIAERLDIPKMEVRRVEKRRKRKLSVWWRFRYSGQKAVLIAEKMYQEADIFLARKRDRVREFFVAYS